MVFDSAGNELRRLTRPESESDFDSFGYSVDLDDGIVVVGAFRHDPLSYGDRSGSAFLFDATQAEGTLAKLRPYQSREHHEFGIAVAIDNGVVVVGADLEAFVYDADRDADGLLDDWERNGIPSVDVNGVEQRLVLPDADPLHKDLYVEVDAMEGFGLSAAAISALQNSFSLAPVSNPDGLDGINLHIIRRWSMRSSLKSTSTKTGDMVFVPSGRHSSGLRAISRIAPVRSCWRPKPRPIDTQSSRTNRRAGSSHRARRDWGRQRHPVLRERASFEHGSRGGRIHA